MPGDVPKHNIDWHQTKGLSLSIIILLIVNIVSTVWWAATLTNDVEVLKKDSVVQIIPQLTERVIRLEAVTQEYNRIFNRVVSTLNKLDSTVDRIDREQVRRGPRITTLETKNKG